MGHTKSCMWRRDSAESSVISLTTWTWLSTARRTSTSTSAEAEDGDIIHGSDLLSDFECGVRVDA